MMYLVSVHSGEQPWTQGQSTNQTHAFDFANQAAQKEANEGIIVIDTGKQPAIVHIVKGTIDLFQQTLNKMQSGWTVSSKE